MAHDTRIAPFLPTQGHLLSVHFEQVVGTFIYPRVNVAARQYFLLRQRADQSGRHTLGIGPTLASRVPNADLRQLLCRRFQLVAWLGIPWGFATGRQRGSGRTELWRLARPSTCSRSLPTTAWWRGVLRLWHRRADDRIPFRSIPRGTRLWIANQRASHGPRADRTGFGIPSCQRAGRPNSELQLQLGNRAVRKEVVSGQRQKQLTTDN